MNDYLILLNQYPNLSQSKVSLSDLGVAHRVFANWKDKQIIDYQHEFSQSDIENDVKRKKIELNLFEALWVLIIQELRQLNIGLSTIKKLKTFLFNITDFSAINDITTDELKEVIDSGFDKKEQLLLNAFDFNMSNLINHINQLPDSEKIYFSPIGMLVNQILIHQQSPSLCIYKNPFEDSLSFEIFNPQLELSYSTIYTTDLKKDLLKSITDQTLLSIPIRPLFSKFFKEKSLLKSAKVFDLFSPSELKILKIIKEKDFLKITIFKTNNETLTIECVERKEIKGAKVNEITSALGFKDYIKSEIIKRNDKHLVINNFTKKKIDLGSP